MNSQLKNRLCRAYKQLVSYIYYDDIYEAYKHPSPAKIKAYYACLTCADEAFAIREGIISRNCQTFTYAYLYEFNDILRLVYMTNKHIYDVPVKEFI